MQNIYLNMKTSEGVETVDEFSLEEKQSNREFNLYVREMVKEYHLASMNVYRSSRCTNDWKSKG